MRFHLDHTPKPTSNYIDHKQKILLVGSCFAENIGEKLLGTHFDVIVNPYGILFNPGSISICLNHILEQNKIDDSLFTKRNGLYFSLAHDSAVHANTKEELSAILNEIQIQSIKALKETDHLIITFGTAFVYTHISTKTIVANCQKLPGADFEKRILSVDEIVSSYSILIEKLRTFNPKLKMIFTVSPVKHLRDGLEENSISKATLLLAVNELKKKCSIDYFPAYELVTDDLRDHRFFEEDLAHPNKEAIHYVWKKFTETYFSITTREINSELEAINYSVNHEILFPESEEAKKFKANLEHKKKELKTKFPFLVNRF